MINERVAYAMNKPYKFCVHFPNEIKETLSFEFYPQENEGKNVLQLYSNGFYYGPLYDGKRNGCGAYYWDDGGFYLGDWIGGERSGEGLFVDGDGYIYLGQFLKGKRHGHGCEYNSQIGGVEIEGDYSEGKLVNVMRASDNFRSDGRYYDKDSKSFTSDKEAMWGCLIWIIVIAIIVKCCS